MEETKTNDEFMSTFDKNCSFVNIKLENKTLLNVDFVLLSKLDSWEDYIVAGYLLTVGFFSTILNGIVVYICLQKMKTLVACDFFILNLAIVDVCMPVLGFPMTIYSSFVHQWIIGKFLCAAYGFIGFFTGVVSIATLAAISYTRYIKVCSIGHADTILKNTKALIFGIYVYATFWACLPLFGVSGYGPESYGTSCTLEWEGHQVFVTFFSILCVIIPILVMNVSYGKIVMHIRSSRRRTNRNIANVGAGCKKRDSYLIKMTLTMCIGFVGLWLPYAVVSLWTAYGRSGDVPVRITLLAVLVAKLSTVVNPLVYFMFNTKYRPIIKNYLTGLLQMSGFCI